MRGKLVEQDPHDEPASVLLEKIKAEKKQLVKEGKIKKSKPLPPITDDEKPFDIPDSWEWVRLGEIGTFQGGFAYKSQKYVDDSKYQVIRLGNVKNDQLKLDTDPVFISEDYAKETYKYHINTGDILFTMTGTRRKRDYFYSLIVNKKYFKSLFLNQRVGCFRTMRLINKLWLNYILKAPITLDEVFKNETGSVNQGNIGSTDTLNIMIPLPSLSEQGKVVNKILQLFDTLKL